MDARVAAGDRRRAVGARSLAAGRSGAGPARRPPRPRRERGGRSLRARLRPRPGPAVADGDEPADRCGPACRGARTRRPRNGSAAADARALPAGASDAGAPRTRVAAPDCGLRARRQRMARDAGRSAPTRVPAPRVRARAMERGRHRGVGQGDGARPRARVDTRPHAPAHVEAPVAGPDPRLLHAVSARQAARRRASRSIRIRRPDGRPFRRGRTLPAAARAASRSRVRAHAGAARGRGAREPAARARVVRTPRGPAPARPGEARGGVWSARCIGPARRGAGKAGAAGGRPRHVRARHREVDRVGAPAGRRGLLPRMAGPRHRPRLGPGSRAVALGPQAPERPSRLE